VLPLVVGLNQWSVFNGLAARECVELCMAQVYTCFERGLGLGLCNICLLHNFMFVVVLNHMWLTSCVATGCRLWANGPSSMGLQLVSVQNNVWQRSTHALSVVWDLTLQYLLAPQLHVCCCVAPRVADKLCCH
jgi:hypothetical protein